MGDDEKLNQLQEIFPLLRKSQILEVLQAKNYDISPSISALLVLDPGKSSNPSSAASSPTSTNFPEVRFPVGLGRLGFNFRQVNFAKDKPADLKPIFEGVTPVGSAVALSFPWNDDDVAEKAPNLVRFARQSGLTTLVSLTISTESKSGLQELQVPKVLLSGLQGKPSFSQKTVADNYVETVCLIAQSKPNYFVIATDINVLAIGRTDEFQRFVSVYKVAYREAKKISPQTKISASFQYEIFKQIKSENLKVLQDLRPELDVFAISSHPQDLYSSLSQFPADHYKDLSKFALESLPVVVLEIGWPSGKSEADDDQPAFVKKLPAYFSEVGPAVFCWDTLRDSTDPGLKLSASGIIRSDGSRKTSYAEWERLQKSSPSAETKSHRRVPSAEGVPLPPPIANINFARDAPKLLEQEVKPYLMCKTLQGIKESPKVPDILATGWPDLVNARVAHLLADTVFHAATQEAVIAGTEFFDQNIVDSLFQRNLDSHIMRVLKTPSWLDEKAKQYQNNPTFQIEVKEDQGPRPHMEDREVVIPYLNELVSLGEQEPPISFFGVFDGHGGRDTADYVATYLPFNLMQAYQQSPTKDMKQALRDSFLKTDADYAKYASRKSLTDVMGSTGVVTVIVGSQLYTAWVGDSEACLVNNNGDVFKFVDCHKPKFESERSRIESLGGYVSELNGMFRVNGMLAVSRAFGDLRLKSVVVADPDISTYNLKGTENFLLLACDGLWDVLSAFDVEEFVDNYVNRTGSNVGVTAELNQEARRRASTDNITIVFVKFM